LKMACRFLYKQCGKDCNKYICRAFFPDRTPYIDENTLPICQGEEYTTECLRYSEGIAWREEKRLKGLTEKCPFAQANRCGRSWEWWCKGSYYPFLLTTYEVREGTDDMPVRDENGDIVFTRSKEDITPTCLSGDPEIYEKCPNYIIGKQQQEEYRKLKSREKNE